MHPTGVSTLEEYRIQRQFREQKRRHCLRQFEIIRQKLGIQTIHTLASATTQTQVSKKNNTNREQKQTEDIQLLKQNQRLKQTLVEIQSVQRQKLLKFKEQMQKAKLVYFTKIKQLRQVQLNQKNSIQSKITKIQQQIENATTKNKQISEFNSKAQIQCSRANQLMDKYSNEIKNQYDKKLQDFNAIFTASSQKINALQNQYNQDQFVESTLQNEQLIQSIRQNSQKAGEQIDKILSDYKQLLQGKTQIMIQLQENNKMKQEQTAKMGALQQKLKTVCQKLGEEKKIYMQENKRMAEQLTQIKDLLTKAMGGQI